ncbi:hypothetical protein V2J09_023569 [Rumex salicifolius]
MHPSGPSPETIAGFSILFFFFFSHQRAYVDRTEMEFRVLVWLCFAVAFAAALGGGRAEDGGVVEEHVVVLDHSNFTEFVSKHDFIVVEFYAPWCGHCKSLAPEYEKAAEELKKHDPPITLAKVDASEETNRDLASQFEIQGFPTIKILRDGGKTKQEYKGPRDALGIESYIKRQYGPASVEIKFPVVADLFIQDKSIFVAGVFKEFSGEEFGNFTKLAEKLRGDFDFGHTSDASLLKRGDASVDKPTIRLLKPFDELFIDFQSFDLDAAEKFIKESTVPSLVVFDSNPSNQAYVMDFFNRENAKIMLFVNFSSEEFGVFKSKFHDIAVLFKGTNSSFLLGDLEHSKSILNYFSIEDSQAPVMYIQKKEDEKYIKPNLQSDELVFSFKQYLDGKLEPFTKSEPIPETNDEPVKVVVYDSIKEMVLNSPKNVLLEFYAPWCGHCKNLAPVLDEVAVFFKDDANVVIAKIDATANDYPSDYFSVKGFPTLYFKSASGKIVEYDGGREKGDMIKFVEEHRDGKKNGDLDKKDEL